MKRLGLFVVVLSLFMQTALSQPASGAEVGEVKWVFKENPLPFGDPIFTAVYYDFVLKKSDYSSADTNEWEFGLTIDYTPLNGLLIINVGATRPGNVIFVLTHAEVLPDNIGRFFRDLEIQALESTLTGTVEINEKVYALADVVASGGSSGGNPLVRRLVH